MTEEEYFELIRQLMRVRGVGGIITRKELVSEMTKRYKPGTSKMNGPIHHCVDKCLGRLRYHGFLKSIGRGESIIEKLLPVMDFRKFSVQYLTKVQTEKNATDRE
jgi:hypothetical protein